MSWESTIQLQPTFFSESEKILAEYDQLSASTFLYSNGVQAIRLKSEVGQIIMLPYQGQQIWHAEFLGRSLTMKTMFDHPNPTRTYLNTYGAFLVHCGVTAMGVPGPEDTHPLHGELPNAPYQTAQLHLGQDDKGPYMAVSGTYQHTVAFSQNYIARPLVKFYADATLMPISLHVKNLKRSDMALMYLAHVNFRPVDNGHLIYSAPCDPQHVRVRSKIPSHIQFPPGYPEFLARLEAAPENHNVLKPDLAFDPEVVFFIDYLSDESGWAYTMQRHPDGSADMISHRPAELNHGIRWISRTADQDCLSLVSPATAEPEGYTAEKAKGHLKIIPPDGEFFCQMETGLLKPEQAQQMEAKIGDILGNAA